MNRVLIKHIILTLMTAALFLVNGTAFGQSDPQYVIMKDGHYLAHVGSGASAALTDATTFNPATCLWYSGPNIGYNYYFIDNDGNYRYLSAPLALNGTLSLSASHPGTVALNNRTHNYYFYDWDHGLARGVQLSLQECADHPEYYGTSDEGDQCWKVVWVSYESEGWQMSSVYGYNPTTNAARFKKVTVTEHAAQVIPDATNPGGAPTLADFAMSYGDDPYQLNGTAQSFKYTYTPAYTTYVFDGNTYYFDANGSQLSQAPTATTVTSAPSPSGYAWALTGEGQEYLSLSATNIDNPTLTYHTQNTSTSHKTATLTLTVTYQSGVSEVRTATVTAKTSCQNPLQDAAPVVTFENVTLSWLPTADKYALIWKEQSQAWTAADSIKDITAQQYTFDMGDLAYGTTYDYRVSAYCGNEYQTVLDNMIYHFTTHDDPGCIVYGAVYGGGRMADVNGDTKVVLVNCDSILAVFGGNDIAGKVNGLGGSKIVLGVDDGDAYANAYNSGDASEKVRVIDVYGGGNGYYMYNGTSLEQAVDSVSVVNGVSVKDWQGNEVWHNTLGDTLLAMPSIVKTAVTVTNNAVKLDSVFGGAKNAFVSHVMGQNGSGGTIWATYGDSIAINGGTILAVFGGNNFGGSQGYGKHYIKVTKTTDNLNGSVVNTPTSGYGRDFGIRYLYGGGNMVYGSTTEVHIEGGQLDTIFAGGNSASVYAANLEVNCAGPTATTSSGSVFGKIYSKAIGTYYNINDTQNHTSDSIAANPNYGWDGFSGIYNVRTLFGGNNQAMMTCLPNVTLTSGSLGTVYGGGNAGEMMAQISGGSITFDPSLSFDNYSFDYSTKVVVNSPTVLVDYLYGGCQMSNVGHSTWVQLQDGHVGTLYGGCNISGDVGSTRQDLTQPITNPNGLYQKVFGATYVEASGGTVYKGVFAGSNGFYHCLDDYGVYIDPITYDPLGRSYVGMNVPTHNETHVVLSGEVVVHGNVYAGGNMAPVGFTPAQVSHFSESSYPQHVGMASVRMTGGEVKCDVYGGGRMASINGSNEVRVTGGSIGTGPNGGALYGGNDRLGKAGGISNRVLPESFNTASDGYTQLVSNDSYENVNTYVGVTGNPYIKTVYGGGNGAYTYTGPGADMQYCNTTDLPIQSNIFVDIAIDGSNGANGAGFIETVYGGGNGVWTDGFVKVFLNVQDGLASDDDHVGTIFGGNNMGDMDTIPDIILLHGKVHNVYGGCNSGAMLGNRSYTGDDGTTYNNIGSLVHLRDEYTVTTSNNTTHTETPDASVTGAVYGGCRMNGVTNSTLVLVEGGSHPADFFGGSDISGIVSGTSQVVVINGTSTDPVNNSTVIGNAFGGGNGNYYYVGNKVYQANDHTALIDTIASGTISRPACNATQVDMIGGTAANLYGGGNAAGVTNTSTVTMTGGNVTAGIYGGCCSMDTIHGDVTVNVIGGTVGATGAGNEADIFGGGYGKRTRTDGNVIVNISSATGDNPPAAPTIYGDVYGGSALGHVNDTMTNGISAHTTTVNILDGTLHGDIYGGGLGQKAGGGQPAIAALVQGKTYVNIGATDGAATPTYTGNATINGDVYGCNNLNGTPMDSVFVNIYKTAHGADYTENKYPDTPSGGWTVANLATNAEHQTYAIHAVYGGGNQAAYTPPLASNKPRCATVHVYGCRENTVKYVYGGGNAADVGTTGNSGIAANTRVIIDGGRIYQMFGGGNGYSSDGNHLNPYWDETNNACTATPTSVACPTYNPGANIYGTARSEIYAGLINEVFGGANQCGSIDVIDLNVDSNNCDDQVYGKVFGCANEAPINHSVSTTIWCDVGTIGQLYGGSNLASIGNSEGNNTDADVTLNIYGGTFESVFAGSKGYDAEGTENDISANIYGDVTLNLYGGTIVKAFGGSDVLGNVLGTITVNVDSINSPCPLILDTVFGSGNLTYYQPYTTSSGDLITSPIVNVKNGTVRQAVFGSGKGATAIVTANPQVNIGDTDNDGNRVAQVGYLVGTTVHGGDVYGGGFEGVVHGGPVVNIRKDNTLVYHQVFGGGNKAGADSTVVNILDGMVAHSVYGGCNVEGTVTGDIEVNIMNNLGAGGTDAYDVNVFGGGLGESTTTEGNVTVNFGDANNAPVHYGDIYGGSALGQVNAADKQTTVNFAKGTLTGNIYGGGLGQASPEIAAEVNGNVVVNIGKDKSGTTVSGGTILGSVFGANNIKGTPEGTVTVNLFQGVVDSIFGGGNIAAYTPVASINYPQINTTGGEIIYKLVGGGNMADIGTSSVNTHPEIFINGGDICTADTLYGVFGGCNSGGTVYGNITVNISGDSLSHFTKIGTASNLARAKRLKKNPVSVHGGGYGKNTRTTGDITVNYGFEDNNHPECRYPKLWGDLYGGSALGWVNDADTDVTTVNVLNGSFDCLMDTIPLGDNKYRIDQYGGNIYGGGLGQKQIGNDPTTAIAALVNGVVHVNIGNENPSGVYLGKADLRYCNVFGCNNANGSPQQDVYVDVYQTAHQITDSASYTNESNRTFAIQYVFGGGNQADYSPESNPNYQKKAHNWIHGCDNTVQIVYGGSNAAYADGTVVTVDGGRFDFVFGGGNGELIPANIGGGSVTVYLYGGLIGWYFQGCNLHGIVDGEPFEHQGCDGPDCCDVFEVEKYYFGANEATIYTGLDNLINCGDNMDFKYVYAGSRLAVIYGDIKLKVKGGTIDNLYGGSEGSVNISADVKKYPADWESNSSAYDPELIQYLTKYRQDYGVNLGGTGGNIILTLEGGKLGNVFGGNDYRGNVEGEIIIIVDSTQPEPCQLDIDYIYGGNNLAEYRPSNANAQSPCVYLKNGHVNYDVYGGSRGGDPTHVFGNGMVTSNPKVVIGDDGTNLNHKAHVGHVVNDTVYGGNVYGGGSDANLKGSPTVVIQGKSIIENNVYGGGKHGNVDGSPNVTVSPTTPVIPPTTPPDPPTFTYSVTPTEGGTIVVTNNQNHPIHTGAFVGAGTVLNITATHASGYVFSGWTVTGTGASVSNTSAASTTFTMGTENATLTAVFVPFP